MAKKTYRIRGLGPGLDGLYAEAEYEEQGLFQVSKLSNLNIMVGDRNVSLQLPIGALYISEQYLEETDEPAVREYESNSGFGEFRDLCEWSTDRVKFNAVRYECAISINAAYKTSPPRTITSFYMFKNLEQCWNAVTKLSKKIDQDDVVFELEAMREWERDNEFYSNDGA